MGEHRHHCRSQRWQGKRGFCIGALQPCANLLSRLHPRGMPAMCPGIESGETRKPEIKKSGKEIFSAGFEAF